MNHAWLLIGVLAFGCENAEAKTVVPVRRADEFRSDRVEATLDTASELVRTRGFAPEEQEWRSFLVEQASHVKEASMRGSACYVFLGAATSAVRELDLRIFDSSGAVVAQDALNGPAAALKYCPPQSGTFYVAARAAVGSGLFAVRKFKGPVGLDTRLDDLFATRRTTGSKIDEHP